MLRFHARTDVGRKRKHNEDSLLAAAEEGLFVVADGVGGRKAGELASAITVNTFQNCASEVKERVQAHASDPGRDTRNAVLEVLDQCANTASKTVYEAAQSTGRQGMTTTLVAAAIGGGSAFIVHVGDSRCYVLRNGRLRQLTEDHSMVNELIRTGSMSREEAATSRYRNVITRAIGLYPNVRTDLLHLELLQGDRLLLCSDGLSDMVRPDALLKTTRVESLGAAVDGLVDLALEAGGRDNVTVIAVDPEEVAETEAVTARANAMDRLFLFRDLPFQARLRVGRILSDVFVSPGQIVVRQGEVGDTLYAVIQGQLAVEVDGNEVAVLEAGEHFGEMALIDQEPRSATIVAKGFGHLLAIERDAFQGFCLTEPGLGNQMLWKLVSTLGRRLRAANLQIASR